MRNLCHSLFFLCRYMLCVILWGYLFLYSGSVVHAEEVLEELAEESTRDTFGTFFIAGGLLVILFVLNRQFRRRRR